MKKAILFTFFLCAFSLAFGQKHLITGRVYLAGSIPLPGATVMVKGTQNGTSTGTDGKFSLLVEDSSAVMLTVQYNGLPSIEKVAMPGKFARLAMKGHRNTSSLAENLRQGNPSGAQHPGKPIKAQLVADLHNWEAWQDEMIGKGTAVYQRYWQLYVQDRISVEVRNKQKEIQPDVLVVLENMKGDTLWASRSDQEGMVHVWPYAFGTKDNKYYLRVIPEEGAPTVFGKLRYDNLDVTLQVPNLKSSAAERELLTVVANENPAPYASGLAHEMAAAFSNMSRQLPFDRFESQSVFSTMEERPAYAGWKGFANWVAEQQPSGNIAQGEALLAALQMANEYDWKSHNADRYMLLFVDATPTNSHKNIAKLQQSVKSLAAKGVKVIPVYPAGAPLQARMFFRLMAIATNGEAIVYQHDENLQASARKQTSATKTTSLSDVLEGYFAKAVGQHSAQ